ncbi:MAG: hypothetical protein D6701_13080 [Gemmatimonadetes bacterium]|nr:MAG: hypothetical protein D6701_13080 [Gemmatimonadota bacterium]
MFREPPTRSTAALLAALLAAGALGAPALSAQNAAPCSAEAYRQFDFWVGTWDVRAAGSQNPPARNVIRRSLRDCVIHEHYRTPSGYEGQSFNIYDRTRGVWHQTWVDNTGLLLRLEGGFADGAMVLEGDGMDRQRRPTRERITWRPIDGDPDRVSQRWERSLDGGKTWTMIFDGVYTRVKDDGGADR